mmetsp:Transcript_58747/g.128610  ORF Transcript_58747/g.128610 Transcript_58747/m.128610 type:complete len:270 (+) Transcript_58747:359-1168(+)
MDLEDAPLRLFVRKRKLNLTINAAWTDHGRIQRLYAVCCHDHLNISSIVKAVQLIQQLQHCTLNLFLATTGCVIPLCGNCIDLIDENDGWSVFLCDSEHFSHQLGPFSQIFLDQFTSDNSEKGCRSLTCDGLSQESFSSARHSIQDDTLGWLNANILVQFRMSQRQFHSLLHLHDLIFKTSNVCIGFSWGLVNLHHAHKRVHFVYQQTNHTKIFVVHENGGARLQLILVDKGQNVHIILRSHGGRHDAVVLVDEFFKRSDIHRSTANVI